MAEPRANGLPAFKQGLVNYSAQIDRKRARGRKSTVGNRQVVPYHPIGDNEFDILTDEFTLTQLYDTGTRFTEDEDLSRTPVLTTVAGIQLDPNDDVTSPQRLLSKVAFAGIAQTRVDYKPEMPAYDAGEEDLAVQIAGVFHDTAVAEDFPFGHKIRLCLPLPEEGMNYYGDQNYVEDKNVGKARLIAKPEGDGRPFAHRLTEWIGMYALGKDTDSSEMTATELAFKNFYQSLEDSLLLAFIVGGIATSNKSDAEKEEDANDASRNLGFAARLADRELTRDQEEARRVFMKQLFAHMVADTPQLKAESIIGTNPNSDINRMLMSHMLRTLAAFSDAMRIDNQWVIGDVIRPAKEGRKYYGILK